MGAGGHAGVTDLDKDTVALVVVFAVTVRLFQQCLCVADLTPDATAGDCLKVCACTKRFCAKLLHTDINECCISHLHFWIKWMTVINVVLHLTNLFAVFGDSCSQGVFTIVLSCTHDGQQSGPGHLVALHNHLDLDYLWSTVCNGAGLIKHH